MSRKSRGGIPLLLLASIGPGTADAFEWHAAAEAGAQYESNPNGVNSGEESDIQEIVVAELGAEHASEALQIAANYDAEMERWVDDSIDSRNTVTGDGRLNWSPTDYFQAFVANQRQDLTVDSQQVDVSSNRDVRSTSTAGAGLSLHPSKVDTVGLQGLYRQVSYQDEFGVDSERPAAMVFWTHELSPVSTLGLNVFAEQVKFDGPDPDLDRQNAYASYAVNLNRLSYRVEAGATKVKPDQGDDISGGLFRAAMQYRTGGHRFQAAAAHVVVDNSIGLDESDVFSTGGSFLGSADSGGDTAVDGGGSSSQGSDTNFEQLDVVTQDQAVLTYRFLSGGGRWGVDAQYSYSQDDYETLLLDERRQELRAAVGYRLTTSTQIGVYAGYEHSEYLDDPLNSDDDTNTIGALFNWQLSKELAFQARLELEQRESDDKTIDYDNNIAYVGLRYVFR